MNAATLFAFGVLVAVGLLAVPLEGIAPAGTASAQLCTPYLADGDVKSYVACEKSRCQWDPERLSMMCYD